METCLRRRGAAAFTLVEMAVALAVLALTVRLAMPGVESTLHSMRLRTAASSFMDHLHLARSEALHRNRRVALCKSSDGHHCTSEGGWEQGWIAFEDADVDGVRADTEELVGRQEALSPGLRLSGNHQVQSYVSYDGRGVARLPNGAFQAGTLTLCRVGAADGDARQVVINAVGRARLQRAVVPTCP